ncbi:MAG: DUF1592 domain-containing protein [Planctomycetota bacterium]
MADASRSPRTLTAILACLLVAPSVFGEVSEQIDGGALFAENCADCHGEAGQGTDYYQLMLAGDLPVRELARVITDTMPEGDPDACVGDEAEAIARHIYDAFYSPLAQARIRPPRRELSRLTVRQYEQSLADLIGEFRWRRDFGNERGLRARFVAKVAAGQPGEAETLSLPRIDFRLSELEALPDNFRDPNAEGEEKFGVKKLNVNANFRGGIWAPKTGDYEFCVRTPNAVELSINKMLVINAKIRSADDDPEVRGTIRLVGGRAYPLHLSTSRTREDDLAIQLRWRPPGGITEVIPNSCLSPESFPAVHATSVRFPPDDRSVGYVRGANVSAAWDEAATTAAIEAVQTITEDLHALAKPPKGKPLDTTKPVPRQAAIDFCHRFAATAFRRPLTQLERQRFVDRFFEPGSADDDEPRPDIEAVELSLLSVLKSPRFLYPEASLMGAPEDRVTDCAAATRLALGLWDSLPDGPLQNGVEKGWLRWPDAVRDQARRMLDDDRTRSKLAEFFDHWLRLDHASQLSRDPELFPDFNDRIAADMRRSLELLLEDVVWSGDGDLRRLFLSEELYVNHRLADFLGLDRPDSDPETFSKAPVDTRERAGVVSHPFTVTAFSYYRDTSPIHRGVFLARHVLGRSLRPPPEAVAPLAPELAPDMTTRQRVAAQTSPGACQACHVLINDLGFTLEHFDAVGRFREEDIGQPIDASGGYIATDGGTVRLSGARDLAHFLADSEDVHRSFVTQLFEHVTKQPILAYGVETRERLLADFRENDFNIRHLLVEIAVTSALAN